MLFRSDFPLLLQVQKFKEEVVSEFLSPSPDLPGEVSAGSGCRIWLQDFWGHFGVILKFCSQILQPNSAQNNKKHVERQGLIVLTLLFVTSGGLRFGTEYLHNNNVVIRLTEGGIGEGGRHLYDTLRIFCYGV